MSEHHQHTEFLKHCLRYDDSPERHAMMEKLVRLQHELRIVKRASWLMGILIVLAGVSLVYPAILIPIFPYDVQQRLMNIILALFAGLSICLLTFIALGIVLCAKLHCQREACRQFLRRILAVRLDAAQKS